MQIQQAGLIGLPLLQHMSKKAILINWSGDVRDPLPQWFYDFDPYCITCFSNMRDVIKINGEFLQIGIDPKIYNPQPAEKKTDIVFMGNFSGGFPLSEYRLQTVEFIRTLGYNFKVFGGWPGANGNLMRHQDEEAQEYREAKIGLSISHFSIDRYFSDRLLRIMGCGCFALSHHYPGIEIDFEVGKHLDTFKNACELEEKIKYYLQNEDERERIAAAGCELVHEKFTTKNMVDDILRIYEKNKSVHKLV